IVKVWKRGTPLSAATTLYEAQASDVSAYAYHDATPGFERDFVYRVPTFFTDETFVRRGDKLVKIDKPDSAEAFAHRDLLLVRLREDWKAGATTYPAGALLATSFDAFMEGKAHFDVLFTPSERTSLASTQATRRFFLLNELDNVDSRIAVLSRQGGRWKRQPLPGMPRFASVSAYGVDEDESDDYFAY